MNILINVTKEIIKKSQDCGLDAKKLDNTKYCAIAHAVREIFPIAEVSYDDNDKPIIIAQIGNQIGLTRRIEIALPSAAKLFMAKFDSAVKKTWEVSVRNESLNAVHKRAYEIRQELGPISFEIDIPMPLIEVIGISEVYKVLSESKSLHLIKI